jgi:hypothetical protein
MRANVQLFLVACGFLSMPAGVSLAQSSIARFVLAGAGQAPVSSLSGTHTLTSVVGQSCAGVVSSATLRIGAGFWTSPIVACYANCDGSTTAPVLGAADFVCFVSRFRSNDAYANCDGSTGAPVLTAADFVCFLGAFRAGCP